MVDDSQAFAHVVSGTNSVGTIVAFLVFQIVLQVVSILSNFLREAWKSRHHEGTRGELKIIQTEIKEEIAEIKQALHTYQEDACAFTDERARKLEESRDNTRDLSQNMLTMIKDLREDRKVMIELLGVLRDRQR